MDATAADPHARSPGIPDDRRPARAPTVLLIEDDPEVRELIRFWLAGEDVDLREAGSLEEARAALAAQRPDAVLLDLHLPDARGHEIIPFVPAGVPIIVVSGSTSRVPHGRFMAYLPKPFDPEMLVMFVRRALAKVTG